MTLGDSFSNITDMNEVLDLIAKDQIALHEARALENEAEMESLMYLYEKNLIEATDL